MLFTRSSWDKFTGQTEWINGLGSGILHTVCGAEIKVLYQYRTIWEGGDCSSFGQEQVGILYCTKCDSPPPQVATGAPIQRSLLIEK